MNDNDKTNQLNQLASEPLAVKGNTNALEALMAETLGDIVTLRKETADFLNGFQTIKSELTEAFSEIEKSISAMDSQVEESIKKHGDKASMALSSRSDAALELMAVKLNTMLQQITVYQTESLGKIRDFFVEQGNQSVDLAKKEMDIEKQKLMKEIAELANKTNGNKLESKLIAYAIILSILSSLITSSFTYMIISNNANNSDVSLQTTQSKAKK